LFSPEIIAEEKLPSCCAAGFIETMDCLSVSRLPEGPEWTHEITLDGYRLEAVRSVAVR
jgi:ATP-dependent DNA ligase